jgi:hypothetical protein
MTVLIVKFGEIQIIVVKQFFDGLMKVNVKDKGFIGHISDNQQVQELNILGDELSNK